ncbi:MAG: hypothetical protein HW412_2343 [Bacteroidetes bacterium]|nr:hypothetical protein [Bacteroidota bacterium]
MKEHVVKLHSLIPLLVAALVVGGCKKEDNPIVPQHPQGISGIFALESIDGSAPPVLINSNASLTERLISGSLVFDPDGNSRMTLLFEMRYSDGSVSTYSEGSPFTYTLTGTSINFSEHGEPFASGLVLDNGSRVQMIVDSVSVVWVKIG